MPVTTPPTLPPFLTSALPFERTAWRLERGADTGRLIHIVDSGPRDARPVWMMHGNPTWSFLWRKVIAALDPDRFRSIAPDLLGFGLSDKLPGIQDHSVVRHVAAMTEVFEALDLRDVILVGQDWGGPIIAGLGEACSDRIAGIVLANTSVLVPKRPRGTAFHRFAHAPVISDLVFRGLSFPQWGMGMVQGDKRSIRGTAAKAYRWPLRHFADRAGPLALARMVPSGPDHPSVAPMRRAEAWIRAFEGPMAMVWGDRDPILARASRKHEAAFPQAPITHCEAGHFLQEEVPNLLAQAIEDVDTRI